MIELFPRKGFSPNLNFQATPVHDVINFKCLFAQTNSYLNWKCIIIIGGWCSVQDPILGPYKDL